MARGHRSEPGWLLQVLQVALQAPRSTATQSRQRARPCTRPDGPRAARGLGRPPCWATAHDAGRQAAAECQGAHRRQRRAARDHRRLHAHQRCARRSARHRPSSWRCCALLGLGFGRRCGASWRAAPAHRPPTASPRRPEPSLPRATGLADAQGCLNPRSPRRSAVGHFRVKIGMLAPPRVVIRDMVRRRAASRTLPLRSLALRRLPAPAGPLPCGAASAHAALRLRCVPAADLDGMRAQRQRGRGPEREVVHEVVWARGDLRETRSGAWR